MPDERSNVAAPVMRVLTALTLLFWSSRFYIATYQIPGATLLTIGYSVSAIIGCALALGLKSQRLLARLDAGLLTAAVMGLVLWGISLVHGNSDYGTDEAAFTQGAAHLLLSGQNPYGVDLSGFLQSFGVSPSGWTATLSGGYVKDLGYPALSFLLTVPLLAIGITTQAQIWVNLTMFCLGAVALWWFLPQRARNAVPLLLALDAYGSAVSTGLIFGISIPFTVLAVVGWDRYGVPGQSLRLRRLSPIFLGLACAVRQDLWILAPFLALAVSQEARAAGANPWRRGGSYAGLVGLGFAIPNIAFIIWDPVAWFHGVLSPLVEGLVPLGQGVVGLSVYAGLGGGRLSLYTGLLLAVTVALLISVGLHYHHLKPVLPLIPAAVLFLSTRSLAQYLLFGAVVAVATIATTGRAPRLPMTRPATARWLRRGLAGTSVVAAGLFVAAITVPAPVRVQVESVHTTGQQGSVDEITVAVHNRTGRPVTPEFVVGGGPYLGVPWLVSLPSAGPGPSDQRGSSKQGGQRQQVAAHTTVRYRLLAPNAAVMPSSESNFKVYAITDSPASVSSSRLETLGGIEAKLSPNAVNRVVSPGTPVELTVQLSDRFGHPVHRAGESVSLGQAQYTPQGVLAAEAVINSSAPGASPVRAVTDARGIARFTVSAPQAVAHEVFFQAWLGRDAPQGYSHQLAVWFGEPSGG